MTFKELTVLTPEEAKTRALSVARARGAARVWQSCINQGSSTAKDLTSHWQMSGNLERFGMLSTAKRRGAKPDHDLALRLTAFLNDLQCPFRTEVSLQDSPCGSPEDFKFEGWTLEDSE